MSGSRNKLYPWESWFSKEQFRLKRYKEFKCMVHSMVAQIRNYATKHGYYVSIGVQEDLIDVKVIDKVKRKVG